ncbi:MAG: tetratricopeptide repeat protein [Spirochaetaceae bacterium]|nr:tetratricopeptide repeat protein [Myxococcales bacterium]MCB9725260.1 tetratricopeptide repeat protein [Spirochaetaceae bacterium]HPG25683.1 hypothetical protein [Myxococcota bacterium]
MAKKPPTPSASQTLAEIEATGDRVAEWASRNAALILGTIAGLLVLAAVVGLYVQHSSDARDEAADALARTTSQYRKAMGADPAGGPILEPANAELASRVRTEYADRFAEVGRVNAGTSAGALAWLEAGKLQAELGRLEDAASSFASARDSARGSAVAALASVRLAALAENRGDASAAAESYERAASVTSYPLRAQALADATRCWLDAEDAERALATYQRLESEFPESVVDPSVAALVAELRARR